MIRTQIRQLRAEENAVSPVIGVILMVAVTVILAAVVAAFVLGFGGSLSEPAPDAQIDFDYDAASNTIDITHAGGEPFTAENTERFELQGVEDTGSAPHHWGGPTDPADPDFAIQQGNVNAQLTDSASISAGDTIYQSESFEYNNEDPENGIFNDTNGDPTNDVDEAAPVTSNVEDRDITLVWISPDGDTSQELASYRVPTELPEPQESLEVSNFNGPTELTEGEDYTFEVDVENTGDVALSGTVGSFADPIPDGDFVAGSGNTINLDPGESQTVQFTIQWSDFDAEGAQTGDEFNIVAQEQITADGETSQQVIEIV